MITIICSTNRKDAVSQTIANAYVDILTTHQVAHQFINLADLPPDFTFTALYENSGKNEAFNTFRDMMKDSEKFVFIVPEYNGSFPGVLKAFIDGLQFPESFTGKKAALVGVSSGIQGAGLALSHLTDIFNYCGTHVLAFKPKLMHIESHMTDGKLSALYQQFLAQQANDIINF
jgi:NAD(P)H-dependent FMN reductase